MSFLKGLATLIDGVDKVFHEEFEVAVEGRQFKIRVRGRVHSLLEPWVFDVTATDVITGTSKEVKHFINREQGVEEAVKAVMSLMKEQGLLQEKREPPMLMLEHKDPGPTMCSTEEMNAYFKQRNDFMTREVLKMLAKKGYPASPPTSPPAASSTTPSTTHSTGDSEPAVQPPPSLAAAAVKPAFNHVTKSRDQALWRLMSMEPDVDGLYTSTSIAAAEATSAMMDPSSVYVTWESPRKGLAYILNNNDFPYLPENKRMRRGSEIDVQNVQHVFQELGYEPVVHRNLKRVEILASLDEMVCRINAEGASHSSVCLILMSHGNEDGISGTDATEFNHRIVTRLEIKERLSGRRCKALLGKPKLIFIQACRGSAFTRNADEFDSTASSSSSSSRAAAFDEAPFEVDFLPPPAPILPPALNLDLDTISPSIEHDVDVDGGGELPNNSDIFVANATSNGYYSIRVRTDGSWFVQALSEVFLARGHIDDLNELMRKVTCLVTERYRTRWSDRETRKGFEVRQTPAYESQGMRKNFFFFPKYPSNQE